MKIIADIVKKDQLRGVWIAQLIIYFGWFGYIFGVLGHVCPATFLGVWNASLLAGAVFTQKRPTFIGTFLSFLTTVIGFGFAFFVLHPPDVPVRYINAGPFIALIITIIATTAVQVVCSKKFGRDDPRPSFRIGILFEKFIAGLTASIILLISLGYMLIPQVKSIVWNTKPQEWFDTLFVIGDMWYLWLVVAIIGLISAISMMMAIILERKGQTSQAAAARLLGHTFFGLILIGTIATFSYFGSPLETDRKD